jgi:polyribonucleotide nucleotidyltransferase
MYRLSKTSSLGAIRLIATRAPLRFSSIQQRVGFSSIVNIDVTSKLMDERYATDSGSLIFGVSTKKMGHLSESSVIAQAGGSVVHVAVNSSNKPNDELSAADDFLPLTVDYRARYSAFGRISDERRRKEKHGSEEEILVGRFVDRAVRALFPKQGYVQEVQILVTNHAADGVHDPTVLAVNAASLALLRSQQPWFGPIGCVRVGIVNNMLRVNPSVSEMEHSPLDLLYAGTATRTVM